MLAFKLALKNLLGAGLRTWLNVAVLSFAFVIIIFYNGMIDGWNYTAKRDTINWEVGQGQLWQAEYDPFDPYTYEDAHAPIPANLQKAIQDKQIVPILLAQASIYPEGRLQTVILKGIETSQDILDLPTSKLQDKSKGIPAMIGERMAKTSKLKQGDKVLLRWRDKNGTFDAVEVHITEVFQNDVPAIDDGQVWIAYDDLQGMMGMDNEATLMVVGDAAIAQNTKGWNFQSQDELLADLSAIIEAKKGSGFVLYGLLLVIALLAIFDTQVLSIFRRRKEIGTYIALGMTRSQVVRLFTIEGAMNSFLAAILGAIYGAPLFIYMSKTGIEVPAASQGQGIAIASKIFPVYGVGLILGTLIFVVIAATIVSYMPARKIAKMKPTDALKGKLT